MLTRRATLLGMLLAPLISGCGGLPTFRYRLTVEVDTPEGLKTGSSVVEVESAVARFPHASAWSSHRGEAVAVDLGSRGVLFALLGGPKNPDWANGIATSVLTSDPPSGGGAGLEDWADRVRSIAGISRPGEVPPQWYPFMVRFRDIADPRTVEEVEPEELSRAFGPGVRIRRIWLQITEDEVEFTLKHRLPWWDRYVEQDFDGSPSRVIDFSAGLTAQMNSRSFSTEV